MGIRKTLILFCHILLLLSMSCIREDEGNGKIGSKQVRFSIASIGNSAATKSVSCESFSSEQGFEIQYDLLTGEQKTTFIPYDTRYSGFTQYVSIRNATTTVTERIDWVENDKLSIFQKHSATSVADYEITSVEGGSETVSKGAVNCISANPLNWESGVDNSFVSIYPSLADKGVSNADWILESDLDTRIAGGYTFFPNEQTCTFDAGDTEKNSYMPDMSYAYMLASNSVAKSSVPLDELQIDFFPDFNAVEFYLVKPDKLELNKLFVRSAKITADVPIAMSAPGGVTKVHFSDASGRPWSEIVDESGTIVTEKSITVKFEKDDEEFFPELEKFTGGKPLKFTFLTMPVDIGELTVELDMVIDGKQATRTLALKKGDSFIKLPKYKKFVISNITVPGEWEYHLGVASSKDTTLTDSKAAVIPIDITSYRTGDKGDVKIPSPVSVKFSLDGETFYSLDDPSVPQELKRLFTEPLTLQEKSTKDGYTGQLSIAALRTCREIRKEILRKRPNVSSLPGFGNAKVTTADGDFANLALYDFVADNFRQATQPKTANCYVIRHPGNYAIPVVYGNGLDYTKESSAPYYNTVAYAPERPDGADETLFLTPFQNFADEGIVDPWIHYDIIKSKDGSMTGDQAAQAFINDYEVVVLWEDVASSSEAFIDAGSLKLNASSVNFGIDGATVVPYITFSTSTLQEGNAVFVIRKKTGDKTIVWSYHIWVSAEEFELSNWTNHNSEITQMLNVPLGFNRDGNNDNGSFYMRLSQDSAPGTGESAPQTIKVNRPVMREDNAPYYQWGRKDPFLPSCGNELALNIYNNSNKKWHSPAGYKINGRVTSTRASDGATNDHSTLHDTHSDYRTEGFGYPIKNPHDICRTGNAHDWIKGSSHPYNLWFATNHLIGDAAPTTTPVKTIYDPCPPGFVVPRKTFATGFTVSGGARVNVTADPATPNDLEGLDNLNLVEGKKAFEWGWWFKRNSSDTEGQFFPAFGTRGINGGGLNFVTARAYYQSATLAEQLVPYNFYFYHWWSRDANPTLSSYVVTLYDTPRPSRVLPSTVWPSAEQ